MQDNLASLSDTELLHFFISESDRFSKGVNSLEFNELKRLRIDLKGVAAELDKRKVAYPDHLQIINRR